MAAAPKPTVREDWRVRLADKRLNGRFWLVTYPCGGWRLLPAWYDTQADATYCEQSGHPLSPDHYGQTAVRVARPRVGTPRHGTGKPAGIPAAQPARPADREVRHGSTQGGHARAGA